jgi:hypothetical protein
MLWDLLDFYKMIYFLTRKDLKKESRLLVYVQVPHTLLALKPCRKMQFFHVKKCVRYKLFAEQI